jgi:hypothetical protein
MTWVLILFVGTGVMGDNEANALTSVQGFASKAQCEAAGEASRRAMETTVKAVKYACAEHGS